MTTVTPTSLSAPATIEPRVRKLVLRLTKPTVILGLIVVIAAVLRLYNLSAVGDANTYYTAAVKSMLQSPSNFFFAAAEPGGSVTVDKPPLGLWIQAISAMIFGVSGVSVVLPQAIAGILAVPLLYLLVRRYFGTTAGLISAFVLAVTPVAIAVERNNTMDATLILTLLCAAWAFIRATDTGKLKYLLLGAFLVGLGFNIKMLQAFLPLPAFYGLYLLSANVRLRRKIAHLVLATILLAVVSFSWATIVQLTPAANRPYIGSTQNNNVFELIFGYNGLNRLLGNSVSGGAGTNPGGQMPQMPPNTTGTDGNQPPQFAGGPDGQAGPQGAQGGGMFQNEIGTASALRLVSTPLGNEIGWLLPFGFISLGLLVIGSRVRFPLDNTHKAVVLWGGWFVAAVGFFTVAGFFHAYYLAMIAPPLAALVGIGLTRLWTLYRKHLLLAGLVSIAACAATLLVQVSIANGYVTSLTWIIPAAVAMVIGSVLIIVVRKQPRRALLGFACVAIAILWVPTLWSGATTLNTNDMSALPHAYSGNLNNGGPGGMPGNNPIVAGNDGGRMAMPDNMQAPAGGGNGPNGGISDTMLSYLESHTQDVEYLVAVQSAMTGSPLVIKTGRAVLLMGGFAGSDPVVDGTKLAQLVSEHKLRYVLSGGMGGPGNGSGSSDVTTWLKNNCTVVSEFSSSSSTSSTGGGFPGMGNANTLYQCGN